MNNTINELSQPVGFTIENFIAPTRPSFNLLSGNSVRIESIFMKHLPSLYEAFSIDVNGGNWTYMPEGLLETCRRHFDKDVDLLLSADGPCVIHRDFRPGNIIAAEGKVRGIIDWSSGRGSFAEDDFCPLEFGEWPASCKDSFLEGYASIRKVPDYKPMIPLLRLSRAVAAVGFTVKRGTWESRNSKLYQFSLSCLESLVNGEYA